ncbi:MAG: hypothetical protein ACOZIN_11480 [Myxococcota bacterium]
MRRTALALCLLSSVAFAQRLPLPVGEGKGEDPRARRGCYDYRVGGYTVVYHSNQPVSVSVPAEGVIPRGSTSGTSSNVAPLSGVGNGGGGEAILVLAVVAAAALPVVIYALDAPASEEVLACWRDLRLEMAVGAGVVTNASTSANRWPTLGAARFSLAGGPLGISTSFESSFTRAAYGSADVHLLLRPPPKEHIEGGFALGARRVMSGGAARDGVEAGLPHRYVLWRDGPRQLGIDLAPYVFINTGGVDFRLEGGLHLPVDDHFSIQLGGRAFSFDTRVDVGGRLGFTFAY